MLLTKDEAVKKWCPMYNTGGYTTDNRETKDSKCIADNCMGWVERAIPLEDMLISKEDFEQLITNPTDDVLNLGNGEFVRNVGYCGMTFKQ